MIRERVHLSRPVRIVVDPANAAGALFAPKLLEELGCIVIPLHCEVDGTFPNHHPDPTVDENLADLRKAVVEGQAEMGIGYDGDCDRLGVVDDRGRIVRGDQVTALLARDQLRRTPEPPILFDVKCSRGLEEDIRAHGGKPVMWKTGHSLAKRKMREDNIPFGGEMSGHMFFFYNYFGFDDAIFASSLLAEIVSGDERKLSERVDELPRYVSTPEIRLEVTEDSKWKIVEEARELFRKKYETIEIDGVRVNLPEGWFLIRVSNTQPVVVLRAEATSAGGLRRVQAEVEAFLKSRGVRTVPWE